MSHLGADLLREKSSLALGDEAVDGRDIVRGGSSLAALAAAAAKGLLRLVEEMVGSCREGRAPSRPAAPPPGNCEDMDLGGRSAAAALASLECSSASVTGADRARASDFDRCGAAPCDAASQSPLSVPGPAPAAEERACDLRSLAASPALGLAGAASASCAR